MCLIVKALYFLIRIVVFLKERFARDAKSRGKIFQKSTLEASIVASKT